MSEVRTKDPQAVLDYVFDFGAQMELDSDTITGTPTVVASPSDLTVLGSPAIAIVAGLNDDDESVAAAGVRAWLSGGTLGKVYAVTCHATTAGGRQHDLTLTLRCQQT